MTALVFDTETTGIPKHPNAKDEVQPRIIEWAGVVVDEEGNVLDEFETFVNPGVPISEEITKITGITNEDVVGAPSFWDVHLDLFALFEKCGAMIAHNLPFDKTMMEMELARNGIKEWPWPELEICTVQEHAEEFGHRPKLTELYEHYTGEKLAQTHRALDDVKALARLVTASGVLSL